MSAFSKALPTAIKEIRLVGCQTGNRSEGLSRQFIKSSYPALKQSNPHLPILVREASGAPARAFARFEYGLEKNVTLEGLSAGEVTKQIEGLLTKTN
ncbi:NADH dehydrogenase, alpha subcomplex, subunit 2 [Wallemia mellicola CBS 633.66]|uniref:NADH dehydrogenase, alpha subcomplex, subunit 2 n=1 Tax=Wallemia mellicola (strain ATCC MYA-4683 / CBS 633.66) TaxID=671144 RepID=I4YDQ7_WALMC|nr:NADH dehydrogenase, alpha subcomplex, subunit 2 [Wallemia mellicola CBS 633.66]EIM22099.1 NADH dehydrogenase, alpha subcomplex, subunit 2 [Wallemia mellicola CBS 633.66]|eukprot:XP_006957750.1 NADH dehydrogenase, alpha subcomplex, subunit 2 [Wallemia mellicola CBS 633.66]